MGVEAAAVAAVVGALASGYGSYKENQAAKKQQKQQKRALAEQQKEELERRKGLIDQQREQLIGGTVGTKGYSTAGIKATIGDKLG